MSLVDTVNQLEHYFTTLLKDLIKVRKGNKAAAQRVRTGTIKLEKTAYLYRKESILSEKSAKADLKTDHKPKKKKVKSKKKKR